METEIITTLVPYVAPKTTYCWISTWKTKSVVPPHLPDEMIWNVLQFVDAQTLSRASCVCRDWHNFALRNELWESLCRYRFGVSASQLKPSPDPTKLLYIMSHVQFQHLFRSASAAPTASPFLLQQQQTSILSAFSQF